MKNYSYINEKNIQCIGDKPSNVLLHSNYGSSGIVSSPFDIFRPITTLTLNTKNICKPCILLKFSSILTNTGLISTTVNFRISRIICGVVQPISGIYTLTTTNSPSSNSFGFQYFDCCSSCLDSCSTYIVEFSVPTLSANNSVQVSNALLSAIVSDKKESCSNNFNCDDNNKVLINYKPFSSGPIPNNYPLSYFTLATISIDSRELYISSNLIQISGILVNASTTQTSNIIFRVSKCINGSIKVISDSYPVTLPSSVANINPISYSFNFQFCDDSNDCSCDCVTYILEYNLTSIRDRAVTINNAFLSVISFIK